jgi:prepilin peptidase CpaA
MLVATLVPSVILIAGMVDDLRSRKVHNWLVGLCLMLALAFQFYFYGLTGLSQGALGALTAFLVTLPFVIARALGAGDLKLMIAFGMATRWDVTLNVLFLALIWGAILGVIHSVVSGQFRQLLASTYNVAFRRKAAGPAAVLHKIPYTIPLAFGWLCYLVLHRPAGGWL